MLHELWQKLKESIFSVLPLTVLVILLYFTPLLDLTSVEIITFIISAIVLIIGIALFSLGADMAMGPMGEKIGSSLIKTKKIKIVLLICFIMGLLITVAEPDLSVLAKQVETVINPTLLIVTVGIGVGVFLVLAVIKIIFKRDLSSRLMFFYLFMFALSALALNNGNGNFLALAYDSGGVTTGPITVPFIMALGLGIAQTIGGREAKENSFGLIALCSIGPILVVLLLSLTINGDITPSTNYGISGSLGNAIINQILISLKEVSIALGLIVVCFLIINSIFIHLPKKKLYKIGIGIIYTLIGLVLFLAAAQIG